MTRKTSSTRPAGVPWPRPMGLIALLAFAACGPMDSPDPRALHQAGSAALRSDAKLLWARNHYLAVRTGKSFIIEEPRFQVDLPALDTLDPQGMHPLKHNAAWYARTIGIAGDMVLIYDDKLHVKSLGSAPPPEARLLRVSGGKVVSEHMAQLPGGFNPAANGFIPTGISRLLDSASKGHYYVFWKSELFPTAMITIHDLNGSTLSWSWQDSTLGLDGMELRGIIQHNAEEYRALFAAGSEAQIDRLACTHHVASAGNLCVSWRRTGGLAGYRRDGWHARAITLDKMQLSKAGGSGLFTRLLWADDASYTAELWTLSNDNGSRCVWSFDWYGCPAGQELGAADKTYSHASKKLRAYGVFIQPL